MRRRSLPVLATFFALAACKPDVPAPDGHADAQPVAAPAEPDDTPLPALRTGERAPEAGRQLSATLRARHREAGFDYFHLELGLQSDETGVDWDRVHVELEGSVDGEVAALSGNYGDGVVGVHVRRPTAAGESKLRGAIAGVKWDGGARRWVRFPFATDGDGAPKAGDVELPGRWAQAVAGAMEQEIWMARQSTPRHPWESFAAGRIRSALGKGPRGGVSLADLPPSRTDLTRLMDTTSGMLSIQEALQHDRGLRLRSAAEPRTIPIAEVAGPPLDPHSFAAMQAQLPNPGGGAAEALAAAAPADFWYVRVDGIPLFFRLMDEADAWITPLTHILQQNPEDRGLAETYQAQLGLERSELARLLGPAVVGQLALVGSDPYLREGSDVSVIFQVREAGLFDGELDRQLGQRRAAMEAAGRSVRQETREHRGVTITSTRDDRGELRQQRARVGELAVVSNSPRAIERVIDAITGAGPRLADEPDLKYMLARDPGAHQAFAFLGDRFIAAAIGPAQKIQAARRELALAELLTPTYAALLHGWLQGASPASVDALVESGLLDRAELKHADGEAIAFALAPAAKERSAAGAGTSSSWGSPAFLTPILDLPPVTSVSAGERGAYEAFSSSYQSYWKQFIDPVAVRLDLREEGDHQVGEVDVRILPLISATDYRDLAEMVGGTRVEVQAHDQGLCAVWAVGAESRMRRDLDGLLRAATGKGDIGIGWLGEWVMLGFEDRSALVDLLSWVDEDVQLPSARRRNEELDDVELWQRIGRLPLYVGADVRNPAALVATLTGVRTMLNEVAPGMIAWGEVGRYRDLPIVRIGITETAPLLRNRDVAKAVGLHYAQTGSAIAVALDPKALERVIDRMLDGKVPQGGKEGPAQFVVDARSEAGRALWTAALWLLQGQANAAQPSAERAAEILLRGAPERRGGDLAALGRAYLGSAPLSSRGGSEFTLTPAGAADPALGTASTPVFGPLPIPGSALEHLMGRLQGVRGEVAFDQEPAAAGADARSLHTRVLVRLGPG